MRLFLFALGVIIFGVSILMLLPACIDVYFHNVEAVHFVFSSAMSAVIGLMLLLAFHGQKRVAFSMRHAVFFTVILWIILVVLMALPLYTSGLMTCYFDAMFETSAHLTTTGITLLNLKQFSDISEGIIFWCCIQQWMGGIGIVLLALTICPQLHWGGMKLMNAEFSGLNYKIVPRAAHMAWLIVRTYCILTSICMCVLLWYNVQPFDALCNAMAILSTGGDMLLEVTHHTMSSQAYRVLIFSAWFGAIPLILVQRIQNGWIGIKGLMQDVQVRLFLTIACVSITLMMMRLMMSHHQNLRQAFWVAFQSITFTMTTVGMHLPFPASDNILKLMVCVLGIIGGCTGSTAGGLKIFRLHLVYHFFQHQVLRLLYPNHLQASEMSFSSKIPEQMILNALMLMLCYGVTLVCISTIFALSGWSMHDSFSVSVGVLSSIGLMFSQIDLMTLTFMQKITMVCGMIMGRLEFMTLVLFFISSAHAFVRTYDA